MDLTLDGSLLFLANASRRLKQGLHGRIALNARSGFDTQDEVIWLGAAPDWSYMQIVLTPQGNLESVLAPTEAQLCNCRDRLRDLWNIVGITSPGEWGSDPRIQGMPFVTSHYGFVMTDYYLITVLSGQLTNIPQGSLTFSPVYPCPFNLPLLLANTTGIVSCANNTYSVFLAFGSLSLPANGLIVNKRPYPFVVSLQGGQSISW